jgi:hypothetical protein
LGVFLVYLKDFLNGGVILQAISKLSDECKKCSHVDDCDNKRMVACAMKEWKPIIADAAAPITMPLVQPMVRVEHPITINMGEFGTINTSREEIVESIKKSIYKSLNCSFSR